MGVHKIRSQIISVVYHDRLFRSSRFSIALLTWWRHAGDAGASEGVRLVSARHHHADLRLAVHERDPEALRLEVPER